MFFLCLHFLCTWAMLCHSGTWMGVSARYSYIIIPFLSIRVLAKMFLYLWKYYLCYCLFLHDFLQVLDSSEKLLPPDELRKRFEQEGNISSI